jgi:tellurite resistance protein TehA-like permease
VKPDAFAAVMATGIVSIAAADHGYRVVGQVLLVVAAVALPVLIVLVAAAWRRESWDITDLDVALGLFTYVAACAVLGALLAGHHIALLVLGGMALQGWLSLAPVVARAMWRDRLGLRDRARGGWELASVATSGLAIVSADLKIVFLAVMFWAVAICLYSVMTGLVVARAVRDSSAPELVRPDIWILMGGAAIATLAGDHIHEAALDSVWPVTVVTWLVATAWIPLLVYIAIRHRVAVSWSAVFPHGMYSSATFATAVETGWRWLATVSVVVFWIAFAAWVIVAIQSLVGFRRSRAADTPSGPTM